MVKKKNLYSIYNALNLVFLGLRHRLKYIKIINFKINFKLLMFFFKKGLITEYQIEGNHIKIFFNYINNVQPLFFSLKFVSKPNKRVFFTYLQLKNNLKYNSHFGLVMTRFGLLSIVDCLKYKVGGEVICIFQ